MPRLCAGYRTAGERGSLCHGVEGDLPALSEQLEREESLHLVTVLPTVVTRETGRLVGHIKVCYCDRIYVPDVVHGWRSETPEACVPDLWLKPTSVDPKHREVLQGTGSVPSGSIHHRGGHLTSVKHGSLAQLSPVVPCTKEGIVGYHGGIMAAPSPSAF